jgi:Spy/CpxP family protein refolding chaperone
MRILVATVAAAALVATAASAQQSPNNGQPPWQQLPTHDEKGDHTPEEHTTKADDKAYRSALDAIPQIKGQDPWRSMREAPKSSSVREAPKSKSPH